MGRVHGEATARSFSALSMDDPALRRAVRKTTHWTGVVLSCPNFVKTPQANP